MAAIAWEVCRGLSGYYCRGVQRVTFAATAKVYGGGGGGVKYMAGDKKFCYNMQHANVTHMYCL